MDLKKGDRVRVSKRWQKKNPYSKTKPGDVCEVIHDNPTGCGRWPCVPECEHKSYWIRPIRLKKAYREEKARRSLHYGPAWNTFGSRICTAFLEKR